ncbi:MAG: glycosyl transferase [Bacteroidetes bacterium QS_7_67_15]|nr:MAG: glycosyl transferase [Bacteroidetes bacterium QS_7_67_15]
MFASLKELPCPPLSHAPVLVSVIVPALNEAGYIERTIASVEKQAGPTEVIVVDGGSTDATAARAAARGARVVAAPKGRARQMNAGAARARGDVLLFLHADTTLPDGALAAVRHALSTGKEMDASVRAGTFCLRFDRDGWLLRLYALATRLVRWRRFCYGDRGLFVRRAAFEAVGGFPDWPIFEDLELADRLHQHGAFCYLPLAVTTAARRFERTGPLRQQLQNLALWAHYLLGTDPEAVASRYRYD